MSGKRRVRRFDWDRLESRDCPTVYFGPPPAPPPSPAPTSLTSEIPVERTDALSQEVVSVENQLLSEWPAPVAVLGDSISYNFAYQAGSAVWGTTLAPLATIDLGDAGDYTQNVLWRIGPGQELRDQPRVVVVEIGINNLVFGGQGPVETALGIEKVVSTIHQVSPNSKVLLLGVLPYGDPDSPFRAEIAMVNAMISKVADPSDTYFLNVDSYLTAPDGTIDANYQPGLIHPNAQGYAIIANVIIPRVDMLLGINPTPTAAPPLTMTHP